MTAAALKSSRYNAALLTGKGDQAATIAYYIRYLSLDRLLEENTLVSEKLCDAVISNVMAKVASQLSSIKGDWIQVRITLNNKYLTQMLCLCICSLDILPFMKPSRNTGKIDDDATNISFPPLHFLFFFRLFS